MRAARRDGHPHADVRHGRVDAAADHSDRLARRIANAHATREPAAYKLQLEGMIRYGASPRATIALTLAARAKAFMNGRGYVTPQDVKSIGADVLRHRIIVSYEAEAESMSSETIVSYIFGALPVP